MSSPRLKRMRRSARLDSARSWLPTYRGKRIARAYRKRYGVDLETAFVELEILGVEIDPGYVAAVRANVAAEVERKRQARAARIEESTTLDESLIEFDEHFAYIAGHTPAGFAYGIPWGDESFTTDDGDVTDADLP